MFHLNLNADQEVSLSVDLGKVKEKLKTALLDALEENDANVHLKLYRKVLDAFKVTGPPDEIVVKRSENKVYFLKHLPDPKPKDLLNKEVQFYALWYDFKELAKKLNLNEEKLLSLSDEELKSKVLKALNDLELQNYSWTILTEEEQRVALSFLEKILDLDVSPHKKGPKLKCVVPNKLKPFVDKSPPYGFDEEEWEKVVDALDSRAFKKLNASERFSALERKLRAVESVVKELQEFNASTLSATASQSLVYSNVDLKLSFFDVKKNSSLELSPLTSVDFNVLKKYVLLPECAVRLLVEVKNDGWREKFVEVADLSKVDDVESFSVESLKQAIAYVVSEVAKLELSFVRDYKDLEDSFLNCVKEWLKKEVKFELTSYVKDKDTVKNATEVEVKTGEVKLPLSVKLTRKLLLRKLGVNVQDDKSLTHEVEEDAKDGTTIVPLKARFTFSVDLDKTRTTGSQNFWLVLNDLKKLLEKYDEKFALLEKEAQEVALGKKTFDEPKEGLREANEKAKAKKEPTRSVDFLRQSLS